MVWEAGWPPARKKPLPRPLIVATILVTVDAPLLVTMPPTYMARGPWVPHWLLSTGIDWVLVASLPVRSEKSSAAEAGAASASRTNPRRRRKRAVIAGPAPAPAG